MLRVTGPTFTLSPKMVFELIQLAMLEPMSATNPDAALMPFMMPFIRAVPMLAPADSIAPANPRTVDTALDSTDLILPGMSRITLNAVTTPRARFDAAVRAPDTRARTASTTAARASRTMSFARFQAFRKKSDSGAHIREATSRIGAVCARTTPTTPSSAPFTRSFAACHMAPQSPRSSAPTSLTTPRITRNAPLNI